MTNEMAYTVVIILIAWTLAQALYPIAQEIISGLVAIEKALDKDVSPIPHPPTIKDAQ